MCWKCVRKDKASLCNDYRVRFCTEKVERKFKNQTPFFFFVFFSLVREFPDWHLWGRRGSPSLAEVNFNQNHEFGGIMLIVTGPHCLYHHWPLCPVPVFTGLLKPKARQPVTQQKPSAFMHEGDVFKWCGDTFHLLWGFQCPSLCGLFWDPTLMQITFRHPTSCLHSSLNQLLPSQ